MLISVDNIMFEKTKLEEQLRLHKVSRDKLLRDTLGKNPKSFNNWKVKWSRLINKKPTDPGNFGLLELSELLVKYFNAMGKDNAPKLYSTYFVTKSARIKGLGVVLPNGQIRVFKKNDHSTLMVPQWKENHSFVLLLSPPRTNLVLYFPALKHVSTDALLGLSIAREAKSKKYYIGFLHPLSNGNYDIYDKSLIDGKINNEIAKNVHIESASKIDSSNYPTDFQWS